MTRLWGLDPKRLCDQHLLGEHKEMHMEVGTLRNHPHGEAIVRGHADRGQVATALIQERHDALARELERRGMNHDSPLEYDDELDWGRIDVDANRRDLAERCPDCAKRLRVRADGGIKHARQCEECGATTYRFERCHECGDTPWVNDD